MPSESAAKTALRWVAQNEWCSRDLTGEHPDWIGMRCKLPRGHLFKCSPDFGWTANITDEVFHQVQVEPVEVLYDADVFEYITESMERKLLLTMWKQGYAPTCPPYWEMWVEQHPYGSHPDWLAGDWSEAHFKVSLVGALVRRQRW